MIGRATRRKTRDEQSSASRTDGAPCFLHLRGILTMVQKHPLRAASAHEVLRTWPRHALAVIRPLHRHGVVRREPLGRVDRTECDHRVRCPLTPRRTLGTSPRTSAPPLREAGFRPSSCRPPETTAAVARETHPCFQRRLRRGYSPSEDGPSGPVSRRGVDALRFRGLADPLRELLGSGALRRSICDTPLSTRTSTAAYSAPLTASSPPLHFRT